MRRNKTILVAVQRVDAVVQQQLHHLRPPLEGRAVERGEAALRGALARVRVVAAHQSARLRERQKLRRISAHLSRTSTMSA